MPGVEPRRPEPHECELLDDATLTGANLSQANLTNAELRAYATLTNADLSQANLTNANFDDATLTGANLTGAEVRGDFIFRAIGTASAQLYSTASYQAHDLTGIGLVRQQPCRREPRRPEPHECGLPATPR